MRGKYLIFLFSSLIFALLIFVAGCTKQENPIDLGGFCGTSTLGACETDAECVTDGCSGQVCRSVSQGPIETTCEYLECYDDITYGVQCGCVNSKCQWKK